MSIPFPYPDLSLLPSSTRAESGWFSPTNAMSRIMGFSFLASLFQGFLGGNIAAPGPGGPVQGGAAPNSYIADSMRLFLLGTIIEGGRRFFGWVMERFKLFQYSITAQFTEGDPAYEWLILLLTEEQIWTRSRQFRVSATSSLRQWTVNLDAKTDSHVDEHAEYVPTYEEPQLFRWKGYWVEVRRGWGNGRAMGGGGMMNYLNGGPGQVMGRMFLTMYTRDMRALSAMVEEARQRYLKTSRPHVIVHSADNPAYGPGSTWNSAKRKARRPLSSIILQEGVINSLVEDAREFIKTEDWYTKAGIPHRRGYLLYGPPGTGKSSTIYAVAGELGLEIYSLSLASGFVDDSFLSRAVNAIPKRAIFLIEDIDCAFPSREELEEEEASGMGGMRPGMGMMAHMPAMVVGGGAGTRTRSLVTLSGLLNVLDGVGSEEGKIFFATTNYIDRLDPALLRPGRIDRKIQYKLATKAQAAALFLRFYPEAYTTLQSEKGSAADPSSEKEPTTTTLTPSEKESALRALSEQFAAPVPDHEFSTAELQGFLLSCKQEPERAVEGIAAWVEQERSERAERAKKLEEEREKKREKKEARETRQLQGGLARLGMAVGGPGGMAIGPPGTFGGPVAPGPVTGGPIPTPMMTPPANGVSGPFQPSSIPGPPTQLGSPAVPQSANVVASLELNPLLASADGVVSSAVPIPLAIPKPLTNGVDGDATPPTPN